MATKTFCDVCNSEVPAAFNPLAVKNFRIVVHVVQEDDYRKRRNTHICWDCVVKYVSKQTSGGGDE